MRNHLKTIVAASIALASCRANSVIVTQEIPETRELSDYEKLKLENAQERIRWRARHQAEEATRNEPLTERNCLEGKEHRILGASVSGPETVMADPEVKALADFFCAEARRQINSVIKAGGYCRLPERKEFEGSTLEGAGN